MLTTGPLIVFRKFGSITDDLSTDDGKEVRQGSVINVGLIIPKETALDLW